jgi:hypothetical protein
MPPYNRYGASSRSRSNRPPKGSVLYLIAGGSASSPGAPPDIAAGSTVLSEVGTRRGRPHPAPLRSARQRPPRRRRPRLIPPPCRSRPCRRPAEPPKALGRKRGQTGTGGNRRPAGAALERAERPGADGGGDCRTGRRCGPASAKKLLSGRKLSAMPGRGSMVSSEAGLPDGR